MTILDNLKALCAIPGISGQEDLVREYIIDQIKDNCSYHVDPLGNIIAEKKGAKTPKNKLYFGAHMDEIGFIITKITDEGYLRFTTVGGIDTRVIFGKSVHVGKDMLVGLIGGKPVHLVEGDERTTPPKTDDMYIDIGAKDKEDAEKHVSVGDFAVYRSPFIEMGEDIIVGKAFDDRAGCAILIDLINSDLTYDVTFGFTVQEEVGCIGGETAAYTVNADISIAIEGTTASDIAGVEKDKHVCSQGKGPVISFKDRGTTYDKKLFDLALKTAKENNIPCQIKEGVFGGNEARVMQTARGGSGVMAISLPTRYIHSPSNTLNVKDIESMRSLVSVLIKELAEV